MGKLLLILFVGKEKQSESCENRQKNNSRYEMLAGNTRMIFQNLRSRPYMYVDSIYAPGKKV